MIMHAVEERPSINRMKIIIKNYALRWVVPLVVMTYTARLCTNGSCICSPAAPHILLMQYIIIIHTAFCLLVLFD